MSRYIHTLMSAERLPASALWSIHYCKQAPRDTHIFKGLPHSTWRVYLFLQFNTERSNDWELIVPLHQSETGGITDDSQSVEPRSRHVCTNCNKLQSEQWFCTPTFVPPRLGLALEFGCPNHCVYFGIRTANLDTPVHSYFGRSKILLPYGKLRLQIFWPFLAYITLKVYLWLHCKTR